MGCRAEPEIPVESRGRIAVGRRAPSRILVLVVPDFHFRNLAQFARTDDLHRLLVVLAAVLLRADLHDAMVLLGGLNHGAAFTDGVRQRLLNVHILAGLAGVDRGQGMPVLVGRHDHRLDVLDLEQFAVVMERLDLLAAGQFASCRRPRVVHVRDGNDAHARQLLEARQQVRAAPAAANQAYVDCVVGAGLRARARRKGLTARPSCGNRRRGSSAEKFSSR